MSCIDLKRDSQLVGNIPIAGKLYIEELHKKGREKKQRNIHIATMCIAPPVGLIKTQRKKRRETERQRETERTSKETSILQQCTLHPL